MRQVLAQKKKFDLLRVLSLALNTANFRHSSRLTFDLNQARTDGQQDVLKQDSLATQVT
jgi:hypothetical protein